jgi:Icc-related predicted phosphoesterase
LAVAGNCDSEAIDARLAELGVGLLGRGVQRDSVGFFGVSAMPPWTGTMYELTEDQIDAALRQGWSQLEATARVLLTHTPPRNTTLDRTRRGEHVGSTSVQEFIERNEPTLVVCGHIHEARGIERLGGSQVVNCGPAYQGCYAMATLDESNVRVQLCKAG